MTFNKETQFLISKFSHELRNPLTTLYGTIQLIETRHPEVRFFQYWSNLTSDINYMNQLLSELSDFSKSEQLNLSTFSLRSLLEQVSLSFAATIADSKVEYTSKFVGSNYEITGDKLKLQEVFLNLLKNAYEASLPDKTIYLYASASEHCTTISIKDTGCGIPEEHLSDIFDPFVTYKKNGTGLGLAICKQIITAHAGKISVQSNVHSGSTFTVVLPHKLPLL